MSPFVELFIQRLKSVELTEAEGQLLIKYILMRVR